MYAGSLHILTLTSCHVATSMKGIANSAVGHHKISNQSNTKNVSISSLELEKTALFSREIFTVHIQL